MATISSNPGVTPTSPQTAPVDTQGTQDVQGKSPVEAGVANGATGEVPKEVGSNKAQGGGAKPELEPPKTGAAKAKGSAGPTAQSPEDASAKAKADADLKYAAGLREFRKGLREEACKKAFEPSSFSRLLFGPVRYLMNNPLKSLGTIVAVAGAAALAITTGNLAGLKTVMPAFSTMIGGLVDASGIGEMFQSGAELLLLQLGVDPLQSERMAGMASMVVSLGANLATCALGGQWNNLDFATLGDFSADLARLFNLPESNAAALGQLVSTIGGATVSIGAGLIAGNFDGLGLDNLGKLWTSVTDQLANNTFKMEDFLKTESFTKLTTSWKAFEKTFGGLESFVQTLVTAVAPSGGSNYRA